MTWEIVVGILTLLAACISICTIVSNNTKAMTEVKCSVDTLNRTVLAQAGTIKEHGEQINDHEIRLTKLEK